VADNIPKKIHNDAIKDQIYFEQYSNGISKSVQNLLETAQAEIAGAIAKNDPTAPTMTKWKAARLEKLNEDISDILDVTYNEAEKITNKALLSVGLVQADNVVNKFNSAIGVDIFTVTLTRDNVQSIVENSMIQGKVIGDWWATAKEASKAKISASLAAGTQAIQIGMVQGESIGQLVRRITGTKTTPGIMNVSKREANALVRTSVMQVAGNTRAEVFKANADVLAGITFVATLDSRTTPICRAIDGASYDMDMKPIGGKAIPFPGNPPLHWQCFVDYKQPIYTSKGWVPIGKIKVGDLVLTHKGRFKKVTELIFTPKQSPEIVKIKLKNNFNKITSVTSEHPFMVNGKWVCAGEIKNGDKVAFLSHKCANKNCSNMIPYFNKYCCVSCSSLSQEFTEERKTKISFSQKGKKKNLKSVEKMIAKRWTKEKKEKQAELSRKQILQEYEFGLRNKNTIALKANDKTRELIKQGKHVFQDPIICCRAVENSHKSLIWKNAVVDHMKNRNPSFNPKAKKKRLDSFLRFMKKHPEKRINSIVAQKEFVSSLEIKMIGILNELEINFIHQYPIGKYRVDFAIPDLKIVIEADGDYWHQNKEKDRVRQIKIEQMGWQVIRFNENQITKNPNEIYFELNRIFANHEGDYEFADFEVIVENVGVSKRAKKLYNFSVEDDESYIASGFVVHNCRTTLAPKTKTFEDLAGPNSKLNKKQLKELDNMPVGVRSSLGGPVPADMNYNDWLLTQPTDVQKNILGQGRWKLWTENKLDMIDLVNNNGKQLTLIELQAALGDIAAKNIVYLENELKTIAVNSVDLNEFIANIGTLTPQKIVSFGEIIADEGGIHEYYAKVQKTVAVQRAWRAEQKLVKNLADPEAIVTFKPGKTLPADLYSPVKGAEQTLKQGDKYVYGELEIKINPALETPFEPVPGYKQSAGMILIDKKTGKIYLNSPKNQFGGYKNSFPKGTIETGLNSQEVAIKEVFEETGLQGKPLYLLGDYKKTTSISRYYVGVKTGGTPAMMGWESEAVQLCPLNKLDDLLNVGIDKKIAQDFIVQYEKALKLGNGNIENGFKILTEEITNKQIYLQEMKKAGTFGVKADKFVQNVFKDIPDVTWVEKTKVLKEKLDDLSMGLKLEIGNWKHIPNSVFQEVAKDYKLTNNVFDDYDKIKGLVDKKSVEYNNQFLNLLSDKPKFGSVEINTEVITELKKITPGWDTLDPKVKMTLFKSKQEFIEELQWADFKAAIVPDTIEEAAMQGIKDANFRLGTSYKEKMDFFNKQVAIVKQESIKNYTEYLDLVDSDPLEYKIYSEMQKKEGWSNLTSFDKLKIVYAEAETGEIKIAVKQLEDLINADAGTKIYDAIVDKTPTFKSLPIKEQIALFQKEMKAQAATITVKGKGILDLTEQELDTLSYLDSSISGTTNIPFSVWNPTTKSASVTVFNSLEDSLKQTYLKKWHNLDAIIPDELLSIENKKLIKQANDIELVAGVGTKEISQLTKIQFSENFDMWDNIQKGIDPTELQIKIFQLLKSDVQQAQIKSFNKNSVTPLSEAVEAKLKGVKAFGFSDEYESLMGVKLFKQVDAIEESVFDGYKDLPVDKKVEHLKKVLGHEIEGKTRELFINYQTANDNITAEILKVGTGIGPYEVGIWENTDSTIKAMLVKKWLKQGVAAEQMVALAGDKKLEKIVTEKLKPALPGKHVVASIKTVDWKSINDFDDLLDLANKEGWIDNIGEETADFAKEFFLNMNTDAILKFNKEFDASEEILLPFIKSKVATYKFSLLKPDETIQFMMNPNYIPDSKIVKIANKTFNLADPEQLKQFTSAQKNGLNKYAKSIAEGKAPTKMQNAFFENLDEAGKVDVKKKIDKYKIKFGIADDMDVVPSAPPPLANVPKLNFDDFVKYKEQEGSNTGGYYYNINNPAEKYYIKIPGNPEIAKNEMLASKLYEAAGTEVPNLQFINVNGEQAIASQIIDGVEKAKMALINGEIRAGVYDDYVVDAWLANWDVVGLGYDNLMVKNGIKGVRIDVGGSLRFRAQGLAKGDKFGKEVFELSSLRDAATNRQSESIFKFITKAELDAGARKVLAVSDNKIRQLIEEFGPIDVAERKKLADTLIERKKYIAEQFPHIKVDVVAEIPKDLLEKISDFEADSIIKGRSNGFVIKFDKEGIEDNRILFWTEKDVQGNFQVGATLKVREDALQKITEGTTKKAAIKDLSTKNVYDSFMIALRGIGQQSRSNEILRPKDIARVKEALYLFDRNKKIIKEGIEKGFYGAESIGQFEYHYKDFIKVLREAVNKEGEIFKWDHDSDFKTIFHPFSDIKAIKKELKSSKIQWVKKKGLFEEKTILNGVMQETGENIPLIDDEGFVLDDRVFQHYYEADIDGVRVRVWPDEEGIVFANRGKIDVMVKGGGGKEQMVKALKALEDIGIDVSRTTQLDEEYLYLKQCIYARNDPNFKTIMGQVDSNILYKTLEDKVVFLRNKLSELIGVSDITKMKEYNYTGIRQAFDNGEIQLFRPDLQGFKWNLFQKKYTLKHEVTKGGIIKSLESILNSGGNLLPTTQKVRYGFSWGGKSPIADLQTGGASYFFTRFKSVYHALSSEGLVWDSKMASRLDAISYSGDEYGKCTPGFVEKMRKTTIEDWKNNADMFYNNEVIFKNALSIFDHLKYVVCDSNKKRQEVIDLFKKHKINDLSGRSLEDVVVVMK